MSWSADCCTANNLKIATGDGSVSCPVVTLTCDTCGAEDYYVFTEKHDLNCCFAFVRYAKDRIEQQKPLFNGE